jgi:phospholipase C
VVVSGTERSILTDIQDCNLPAVSWVIPDGLWSDHAGSDAGDGGPSWVAAIVNAVGVSPTACDSGYWSNTVILITWDDWGGFYDHVLPYDCSNGGQCNGYPGGQGTAGQQYVYGFRVPGSSIGGLRLCQATLRFRSLRNHGRSQLPERATTVHSRLR